MNATTDLSHRIRAIFANRLQLEIPEQNDDLIEAGILDSLALVDLINELEREFGFRLPSGQLDFDEFRSLDRIAKFVERSQSTQRG